MSESVDERYPEHAKLLARKADHAVLVNFLSWVEADTHYALVVVGEDGEPYAANLSAVVAEFFAVDQAAFEQEKRAMIEEIRAANERLP